VWANLCGLVIVSCLSQEFNFQASVGFIVVPLNLGRHWLLSGYNGLVRLVC